MVLTCALPQQALGIDNIMRFDWLAPPPAEAAVRGLELLYALGGLDGDARCEQLPAAAAGAAAAAVGVAREAARVAHVARVARAAAAIAAAVAAAAANSSVYAVPVLP